MSASGLSSRAIIGQFYHALEQNVGSTWVSPLSTLFQSDQESETYKFMDQSPVMREWVGGRMVVGLAENGITITNKTFESTLEIPADWVRRDKTDQISIRIKELARRADSHYAQLLSTLIANGESGLCYDEKPFFATDHPIAPHASMYIPGSQSNKISWDVLSTTVPTNLEFQRAVMAGVSQLLSLKDDQNQPLNENASEFIVIVPNSWRNIAGAALGANVIGMNSNEVMATGSLAGFNISLAVNPRLSWTTKLAVFRADGDTTPFIRQEEVPVSLTAIAEGSEQEFQHGTHFYGVTAIHNVGYGYWQKACLVTLI